MEVIFISSANSVAAGGGGQQICSREYRAALAAAGFRLNDVLFTPDRRLLTRIRIRLRRRHYHNHLPDDLVRRVVERVQATGASIVFANLNDLIPAGSSLRAALPPPVKLVLLSHGLASVDEVHTQRIAGSGVRPGHTRADWTTVAGLLAVETQHLSAFDHVFGLAEFETGICHWLGARSVSALPRTVTKEFLPWKPSGDRVGCIGTMDHPPNEEGLWLLLRSMAKNPVGELRVRLISRSHQVCAAAAAQYPFVDYLGPVEDPAAVHAEAGTWSAFLHPIFCHAMGCSTKVAVGLAWGLPVVTSDAGLRGYDWATKVLTTFNTPDSMAARVLALTQASVAETARQQVMAALRHAPTLAEVAAQARRDLGLPASAP